MTKFCKNCGTELEDGARFCKSCGESVSYYSAQDITPQQTYQPPVEEKSYIEYLIVGIIGSLFMPIVGFAIGIWLYTRKTPMAKRNGIIVIVAGLLSWLLWIFLL